MKRLNIDRAFEVKAIKDDGTFVGYGSVFGELDSYRDIVMPGAFTNSLKEFKSNGRKVPMLWQHDARSPIGVYTKLTEDDTGLLIEGECNLEVQQGRECHSLMKQGALTGLSIGYSTERDEWDETGMTRKLFQVKLWEISPVTFPAGDSARVSGIKAFDLLTTLSECEASLRDAGYTKSEATGFIARVKALAARSDSADADQAMLDRVAAQLRTLKI